MQTGEVLHDHPGRRVLDSRSGSALGVPAGQRRDVVGGDVGAVLGPEQVLEQHLEVERQRRDVEAFLFTASRRKNSGCTVRSRHPACRRRSCPAAISRLLVGRSRRLVPIFPPGCLSGKVKVCLRHEGSTGPLDIKIHDVEAACRSGVRGTMRARPVTASSPSSRPGGAGGGWTRHSRAREAGPPLRRHYAGDVPRPRVADSGIGMCGCRSLTSVDARG